MEALPKSLCGAKPLIAAHRGLCGGNIPPNTLPAFEAALCHGADIIELDVTASSDGCLFVFHPGMEKEHLRLDKSLCELTRVEIEQLRFVNHDGTPTNCPICTLEEALRLLRGCCTVNIDKFWMNPGHIAALVRKLGMQDQVIVKTDTQTRWFDMVEELAPDLPYMVFVHEQDVISDALLRRRMRYIGTEVLFTCDDQPVASSGYVHSMHDKGLLVWANAIVYDYKVVLSAGHNDDLSIIGYPDVAWGWLIDRGFDIIQTDWPTQLRQYIQEKKV